MLYNVHVKTKLYLQKHQQKRTGVWKILLCAWPAARMRRIASFYRALIIVYVWNVPLHWQIVQCVTKISVRRLEHSWYKIISILLCTQLMKCLFTSMNENGDKEFHLFINHGTVICQDIFWWWQFLTESKYDEECLLIIRSVSYICLQVRSLNKMKDFYQNEAIWDYLLHVVVFSLYLTKWEIFTRKSYICWNLLCGQFFHIEIFTLISLKRFIKPTMSLHTNHRSCFIIVTETPFFLNFNRICLFFGM